MGNNKSAVKAHKVDENEVENGGIHLFEWHFPSTSFGFIAALAFFIAIFLVLYFAFKACRRCMPGHSRRSDRYHHHMERGFVPQPQFPDERFYTAQPALPWTPSLMQQHLYSRPIYMEATEAQHTPLRPPQLPPPRVGVDMSMPAIYSVTNKERNAQKKSGAEAKE